MQTLDRAEAVFGFTKLNQSSLPINMTQWFAEVVNSLQIAVLRQALVLAEEYSIEDIPTFIRNVAASMTMMSATSGASVAQLQSLSPSQGTCVASGCVLVCQWSTTVV